MIKINDKYKYDAYDILPSVSIYNLIHSTSFTNIISISDIVISDDDYRLGTIVRYFFKQKNISLPIIETDKKCWEISKSNPLYLNIKIDWRISGKIEMIEQENFITLVNADKILPGILKHLEKKLSQYSKL